MKTRLIPLTSLAALFLSGCVHVEQYAPVEINTDINSPVRIQMNEKRFSDYRLDQFLLLPPLGIEDKNMSNSFHSALSSAMKRRLTTPLRIIEPDGAYAPYLEENNLIFSDGTINAAEASIIGKLMACDYVICPYIIELRPYHPQRLSIRLLVVCAETERMCAEITGFFDVSDNQIFDYFVTYSKANGFQGDPDDLRFKIKSPATFQAFIADLCTVMAEKLETRIKELQP
jgi:hypothetical protein